MQMYQLIEKSSGKRNLLDRYTYCKKRPTKSSITQIFFPKKGKNLSRGKTLNTNFFEDIDLLKKKDAIYRHLET